MLFRVSLFFCLLMSLSAASAQSINARIFDQGLIAFDRGEYSDAARILRPLAEQGDARAQFLLGFMYRRGRGVPQDFAEALKWLRRAADQNEAGGLRFLGSMYYAGEGVPRDLVSAYVWISLGDAQTKEPPSKELNDIARQLTPAQMVEVKKRINAWKPGTIAGQSAATPQATLQPGPAPLVGYGHVSRSDGLKTFFVAGTFPNASECERISKIFSDNWVNSAKAAGHSGKLESLTCNASVPRGTEYESLRHGTAAKHYIFFTERLRLMFVHERGTLDYERAMCERMRDAMKATDPNATCDAPKQSKQAALTPDAADKDVSIGYGRVSRGDGLNVFFVLGSFPTRKKCEDAKKTFGDTVLSLTKSSGHSVKIETSACDAGAPSGTYYEALRNGNPVKHYTLFHPDMTVMFMHQRGTADEERVLCERTRDAMKSTAPNAECYRPSPAAVHVQAVPAQPATAQPAMTQDAIAKAASQLNDLSRSEILRGIKGAEKEVAKDLEPTIADAKFLSDNEKDVAAYYKRASFCYRALMLLLEKNSFPDIAVTYRARAQLYDDILQGKVSAAQFETREKENDAAKLRAVTAELAALDKKAPPKEPTLRSLERLGYALGQIILVAAHKEQGDVPYVHSFNQGMIALKRDDHAGAAKLLRPLAERGDPRAQHWIGYMHLEGLGLPQDFPEALKWLQRSADQGENGSQYQLARIYAESRPGISRDLVSAYMWLSLAASRGHEKSAKSREDVGAHLTPAQIGLAKKRASEWKPVKR